MKNHTYITILVSLSLVFIATPIVYASQNVNNDTSAKNLITEIIDQLKNPKKTATSSLSAGFARDGVFGCTGGEYGSVGAQGPRGAHVPVFDNATFDQQRLLTYKECVLDGVVVSMREELISFMVKNVVDWNNKGFNGNKSYITNYSRHQLEKVSDPIAEKFISGKSTEVIPTLFRRNVRTALAKSYASRTRTPENALRCGLNDTQLKDLSNGNFYASGGLQSFYEYVTNPACNPLFSYNIANNQLQNRISSGIERDKTQLGWGRGFLSTKKKQTINLGGGNSVTVSNITTPGFLIAETLKQTLGTGLRQTENATEINQIISALMSNIGTEMLTNINGLAGLSKAFNGQPSYVDRVVTDARKRNNGNMIGAAARIVNNTLQVEKEYTKEWENSIAKLKQTKQQLEAWENTCWSEVAKNAKKELAARLVTAACIKNDTPSASCKITANITVDSATNTIGIKVPSEGNISVFGRAKRSGSIINVTVKNGNTVIGPIQPTVDIKGYWKIDKIDLSPLPNGTSTVTAIETLSGGAGTLSPITAIVQKITTLIGVELIPPEKLPAITIKVTLNGSSESATIVANSSKSRVIINQNINPILNLIIDKISRSSKALDVLAQIRSALESTSSISGQRFILDKLNQLVAAHVLHTEDQLREARKQSTAINEAMDQLLEKTKTNWEGGWCKASNWEQNVQ